MDFRVEKYCGDYKTPWDNFVSESKNGTFLFQRDFMEYHSDRFADFSLMVYENKKLIALLPANILDKTVYSHQGLTYGGLVYNDLLKLKEVVDCLLAVLSFLHKNELHTLMIKSTPSIYYKKPSDEFLYALFLAHAQIYRRDSLSIIDLQQPFFISKTRKENIRRGAKNNLIIREETNFELFWNTILIPNMKNRHNVKPIHTAEEITALQIKFPTHIRHFNVYFENKIVAGTTIFVTDTVAHAQHISALENRNILGSIDFLYHYLISDVFKNHKFFDFGISNEEDGRTLNSKLIFWKESFGANTVIQDFYSVETENFELLKNFLV